MLDGYSPENEHNNLRTSVQGRGDEVIVPDKLLGIILPEPKLCQETKDKVHAAGCIGTHEQPAHVPEHDGRIDVLEEADLRVPVHEPERNRDSEAEQERKRNPLVAAADGKHVARDAPGNGESIVLLHVLTRPDIRSLNGSENLILVVDDADHHDIVEYGAHNGSEHLRRERGFGREVSELGQLEVFEEKLCLAYGVEREDGKAIHELVSEDRWPGDCYILHICYSLSVKIVR